MNIRRSINCVTKIAVSLSSNQKILPMLFSVVTWVHKIVGVAEITWNWDGNCGNLLKYGNNMEWKGNGLGC